MSAAQSGIVPTLSPAISLGLPSERTNRIATRRAFVEMKQAFLAAAADIAGSTGDMLQRKLRCASEPWQLWSLRAVILASLQAGHVRTAAHRKNLQREIDVLFDTLDH